MRAGKESNRVQKLSGLTIALSKNSSCYGRKVQVYIHRDKGGYVSRGLCLGLSRLGNLRNIGMMGKGENFQMD